LSKTLGKPFFLPRGDTLDRDLRHRFGLQSVFDTPVSEIAIKVIPFDKES